MEVEEIRKQAELAKRAVADLEEPLKTEAFKIILSRLLEDLSNAEKTVIGEPLIVGKISEQPPAIQGATSCRDAIAKLFASEWGRRPRTAREIMDAMKLSAVYYSPTNVSVELGRMTRLGLVRRLKDPKGWTYVSAAPTPS